MRYRWSVDPPWAVRKQLSLSLRSVSELDVCPHKPKLAEQSCIIYNESADIFNLCDTIDNGAQYTN